MFALRIAFYTPVFLIFFLTGASTTAQVTIEGPACVTSGVGYQYNLHGPWQPNTLFKVCIAGGTMMGSDSTCVNGNPVPFIRVNWNDSNATGSIVVTSDSGNATLNISITKPLQGGTIDSAVSYQLVSSGTVPSTITCGAPSYGNCAPSYQYQWQQSYDMLEWQDVSGATDVSLSFSATVTQVVYYRRKVTETASGAIAFSNPATVDGH